MNSKNVSRRNFLKGLSASAITIAGAGVISSCKAETQVTTDTDTETKLNIPDALTMAEVEASRCVLEDITPSETKEYDLVVVGAGAAGIIAACTAAEQGASVALLQKGPGVLSQGNCASAIIKSKSTSTGIKKWIHHTNGLCDWRSNTKQLEMYAEYSEKVLLWYLNKAGLTEETEYGDGSKIDVADKIGEQLNDGNGLYAFRSTSSDFHGIWKDRNNTYDYGDDHCYVMCPWIGPKPKNVTHVLTNILNNVLKENVKLDVFYKTPGVKLIKDNGKIIGVIGKKDEKYIQFNGSKGVIVATGDYENNEAMVNRWCPDIAEFDKKQTGKTGDGHVMTIAAGAVMENLGHTKMMHDFDSCLMWEEPFLYVNMEGKRFTNEYTGFVYMSNILRYQPAFNGNNVDANHKTNGSKGWYCQVWDSSYMDWPDECFVEGKIPPSALEKYIPGAVENPTGVFTDLLDLHRCDTLEELAKEIEVPEDEFITSVKRYNELCDKGEDTDFGKPSTYMHKITQPPFYAARKHIRVSAQCSGVNTNEYGQALDKDNNIINGLYCAGNLGGKFYGGNDYPFHHTGLSLGRCYTFGYIAAMHALGKI